MPADPGQPGPASSLSAVGAIARLHDPDRFLTALFAPAGHREAIFTLIAFNHELARALDIAASSRGDYGAIGGHIRLQWWREVLDGDTRRHEVAAPLAGLLDRGTVGCDILLAMVDARATELDGFPDQGAWLSALRAGPGNLACAIAHVLGVAPELQDRVAGLGVAYAIGKMLRHRPTLLTLGRRPMTDAMLHTDDPSSAIEVARPLLRPTPHLERAHRAAFLLAILARRDLKRAAEGRAQDAPRSLADRLAVTAAFFTGRL